MSASARCIAPVLLCLVTGSNVIAQHSLIFVPEDSTTTNGGAVMLDRFVDTDLLSLTPTTTGAQARKFLARTGWSALLGDEDADGHFFENIFDEVNAVTVDLLAGPPGTNMSVFDLIFSSQESFGQGFSAEVDDGSLWRLTLGPGPSADPVELWLDESVLQAGLGTTSGLDVDAAAIAADGELFLSLRNDEMIHGDAVSLKNGAIATFAWFVVSRAPDGSVKSLGADSVSVALDEAAVTAMVVSTGVLASDGSPVTSIGNLSGLAIDPAGGTFLGTDGLSHPNLLFSGTKTGPRVFTTSGGGGIATLNGQSLGSAGKPQGAPLGLDGEGGSPAALLVVPEQPPPLVIDLDKGALTPTDLSDVLHIGNGTPNGSALLFIELGPTAKGSRFSSAAIGTVYRFPALYTLNPALAPIALPLDASGRVQLPFQLPPPVPVAANIIIQIGNLTGALELSAPAVLAYTP